MSDNYDTTKQSVKDAYAEVFRNPTIENKNTFMRNSDAFREEIRKREPVVVVDPPVDADADAKAVAEKAAREAADAVAKAAAEKAAADAAAKAAADAAAKAAAEKDAADRVAAEREAAEKAQLKKTILDKFGLWRNQASKLKSIPSVDSFFKKHNLVNQSLDSMSIQNLQTRVKDLQENGQILKEFDRDVRPHLGTFAVDGLDPDLMRTHSAVGIAPPL